MLDFAAALGKNPVFEREFVRVCRSRKWFFLRTGAVAAVTLMVWLFFLRGFSDIETGNLDTVGRSVFAAACFTQILCVFLLTPGLTADLIASERRTRNLEVLLSTPMTPLRIVAGKLFSRVALLLVIVAASFPVVAITLLFGGVRAEQVGALFLLSSGLVLLLAGPSLFFSAVTDRTALAAGFAYLLAFVPAIVLLLPDQGSSLLLGAGFNLAYPDPDPLLRPDPIHSGLVVLGLGAASVAISFPLCVLKIRRDRAGNRLPTMKTGRVLKPRRLAAYDRFNPMIAWENLRIRGRFGRGPFWAVLVILLLLEGVLLFFPVGGLFAGPGMGDSLVATVEAFVILLFTVLAGSTSVISDREQGTIELLRLTDLTPREVVQGKAMGTARASLPLVLVPIAHLVLTGAKSPVAILSIIGYAVVVALATGICAADGVMNSIHARTVPRAVIRSMWHFSWMTLFLPVLQFLLPLLFLGQTNLPTGPHFTLLYPIWFLGANATGTTIDSLHVFGFFFWLFLMGILAAGLWALLSPGGFRARPPARRNRPATLSDWRESWSRLAAQWDEED